MAHNTQRAICARDCSMKASCPRRSQPLRAQLRGAPLSSLHTLQGDSHVNTELLLPDRKMLQYWLERSLCPGLLSISFLASQRSHGSTVWTGGHLVMAQISTKGRQSIKAQWVLWEPWCRNHNEAPLPFTCCVTLGHSLNISVLWSLCLNNGERIVRACIPHHCEDEVKST